MRRQKLLPTKIGIVAKDDRLELDISRRYRHVLGVRAAQLQVDRPLVAAFAIRAGDLEAVGRDQRAGGAALQAARRGQAETEGKITRRECGDDDDSDQPRPCSVPRLRSRANW